MTFGAVMVMEVASEAPGCCGAMMVQREVSCLGACRGSAVMGIRKLIHGAEC